MYIASRLPPSLVDTCNLMCSRRFLIRSGLLVLLCCLGGEACLSIAMKVDKKRVAPSAAAASASSSFGESVIAPATPHDAVIVGSLQLTCQKCEMDTTHFDSAPAGAKNPSKRNCNRCNATDRWINRAATPKKRKVAGSLVELTDQDKARQTTALELKKRLAAMNAQQKREWYRSEKVKREEEDKSSKRSFAEAEAFVDHVASEGNIDDEVDAWQTFRQFAIEKILLKECVDVLTAEPLWKVAVSQPGAKVRVCRGQSLLGVFGGMESRLLLSQAVGLYVKNFGILQEFIACWIRGCKANLEKIV